MAADGWRIVSALPARGEVWWCEMAEIARRMSVCRRAMRRFLGFDGDSSLGRRADTRMWAICEALEIAVDCSR